MDKIKRLVIILLIVLLIIVALIIAVINSQLKENKQEEINDPTNVEITSKPRLYSNR